MFACLTYNTRFSLCGAPSVNFHFYQDVDFFNEKLYT